MPLACSNPLPVLADGEPLLVVVRDHILEFVAQDLAAMRRSCRKQVVNDSPTLSIEFETELVRSMSQHEAEELADACMPFVHSNARVVTRRLGSN